jgi:hypothetical protein
MPKLFEDLNFDSVCCSLHGKEIQWSPFAFDKHTIMFLLTSNEGAFDFKRWL